LDARGLAAAAAHRKGRRRVELLEIMNEIAAAYRDTALCALSASGMVAAGPTGRRRRLALRFDARICGFGEDVRPATTG
jgi:hypothetical protein